MVRHLLCPMMKAEETQKKAAEPRIFECNVGRPFWGGGGGYPKESCLL